jgi:hypothetical protein
MVARFILFLSSNAFFLADDDNILGIATTRQ